MSKIIEFIENCEDVIHGDGIDKTFIEEAEIKLGLEFADDYKEYLEKYKIMAISGNEISGLSDKERVNVVSLTNSEKKNNENITDEYYVIEKTNIDNIIIWQKRDGSIYQTIGNSIPKKIEDSLINYLQKIY